MEGRLVKNCIRAIFYHEFSSKTHLIFMQTKDAPSMALLVLHLFGPRGTLESRKGKWQVLAVQISGRANKTAVQMNKIQKKSIDRKKICGIMKLVP